MKKIILATISSAALALSACGDGDTTVEPEDDTAMMADDTMAADDDMAAGGTIVEVAQGDSNFSTLVGAVTTADLASTLGGEGPYTVFAPTNAAFEKVDSATLENLMSEGQREQLSNVLSYHVVEGNVMAADLTRQIEDAGGSLDLTTVSGGTLTATIEGGNVMLTDANGNSATVTSTDVEASNGVIHAIDTVLMPAA
ncbi:fasciclin domain-containing protein [Sphingomicrobium sp. XHP0235]|uniref:fasciclin domain-containing protein n=1 Tax=Sphingomicrobium aquimarinum TaxID=3133971 RepID=UPI0031FEE197